MASDKRWIDTARDAATIVASILLAFGIDASWDRLQARRDALDSLERVVAEVEQARAETARAAGFQERFRVANLLLMDVVMELEAGRTVTIPDSLLLGLLGAQVVEVSTNNVAHFVASESFELIRDLELRAAIGRWIPTLEDQLDDQLNHRRLKEEQAQPILRRSSDVAGAQVAINPVILQAGHPVEGGNTRLLVTDELRALVARVALYDALDLRQREAIERLAGEIDTRARAVLGRD